MSQTKTFPGEPREGPLRAQLELSRMLREGRSWSGRERNCAFLNTRDGRFADISALSGFDLDDDARALALIDWDGDGDLDVWVTCRNAPGVRVLRNDARSSPRSVTLRLRGDGTQTHHEAVGARVILRTRGGGTIVRGLRAGEGFLAQSTRDLVIGLGDEEIERVSVVWPGGAEEEFAGVEAGKLHELRQGAGRAAERRPHQPSSASPTKPLAPSTPGASIRIPLLALLRAPEMRFESFDGQETPRLLAPTPDRDGTLVVLWASWCTPCLGELSELTGARARVKEGRLDVVALSVDALDPRDTADADRAFVDRLGPWFRTGRATPALLKTLEGLHDVQVPVHKPLPVPSSFLFDREGRLAVIYKGRVSPATVLEDLAHARGTRRERELRAALRPGRIVEHALVDAAKLRFESALRFRYAHGLAARGAREDAIAQYRDLVAMAPEFGDAWINLSQLERQAGRLDEALLAARSAARSGARAATSFQIASIHDVRDELGEARAAYEETLRLDPDFPGAHDALGVVLVRVGDRSSAAASFAREIELHPDHAPAWNHLGVLHLESRRLEIALTHFERAVALDPQLADAHNNLGTTARLAGDLSRAESAYRRAEELSPGLVQAVHGIGLVRLAAGDANGARDAFRRALTIDPDFAPAKLRLAELGGGRGR